MILSTKNLSIGYKKDNPLLQNINIGLQSESLTCIIGRNGAGKSTLLRTISGIQKALSGKVFLSDSAELSKLKPNEIAKIISVVLTDSVSDNLLTVKDLVSMGRMPYTGFLGKLSKLDNEIIDNSINRLNINHLRDRFINTLSDGQRQRVLIAKALAQQSLIIILDEPTAFLDFEARIEIMEILKNLCCDKKTILISTHEIDLVRRYASHLWLFNSNSITCGTIEDCAHLLPHI